MRLTLQGPSMSIWQNAQVVRHFPAPIVCPAETPASCDGVAADSLDWFKIGEATYAAGKWPTELLSASKEWPYKIPTDLAPG